MTLFVGLLKDGSQTKHRSRSAAFKHQVAREFLAGKSATELSRRHGVSRHLIRIWVGKVEAGALEADAQAAELIEEYEARIAALERMVGRQVLEIEFPRGAPKHAPPRGSATPSVTAGPPASASARDAG